jgi:hypothetical protein
MWLYVARKPLSLIIRIVADTATAYALVINVAESLNFMHGPRCPPGDEDCIAWAKKFEAVVWCYLVTGVFLR